MKTRSKKKSEPLKLDLGCGARRPPEDFGTGWSGIDISPDVGADYVMDLAKFPWPFKDESVEELWSSHFVEHLEGPTRCKFMDECWRILKVSGKFTIVVPYWSSMRSIQDPTHKWPPIAETSFLYFNKGWRDREKLSHYPIKCDFDFTYGYAVAPELRTRNDEYIQAAQRDHVNSVWDLMVTLTRRAITTNK